MFAIRSEIKTHNIMSRTDRVPAKFFCLADLVFAAFSIVGCQSSPVFGWMESVEGQSWANPARFPRRRSAEIDCSRMCDCPRMGVGLQHWCREEKTRF